jgi:hypothetical protein
VSIAARIAYDKLNAESPALITRANTILSHLAEFTTVEKDYPFVECATFADDIKSKGWDDQADWHFVDNPFFDDGYKKADWYPNLYNITWEMVHYLFSIHAVRENSSVLSRTQKQLNQWKTVVLCPGTLVTPST